MAKANSIPDQAVYRAICLRTGIPPQITIFFDYTLPRRDCQGIKNLHISRRKRSAFCREQLEKDGKIVYSNNVLGKLCLCVEENNIIHYIKEN